MSDRESFGSMSFRLGSNTRVYCHAYPDVAPIFALAADGWSLALSPAGRDVITDGDVANARRLVEAVTTYLAELERLHAGQTDASTAAEVA